jgi:GTP-binding protein
VTADVEYYSVNRAVKTIDDCDVVILMIDAREGLTDQDKKIAGLAMERGRGIILALNKWDEMPDIKSTLQTITDKIHFHFGQIVFAPVLPLSAKTGFGVEDLLKNAVRLFNQLNRRIETGPLNQAVKSWMDHSPPPVGRGTHFKLRYATQVSANPVRFVFFVSRPQAVSDSYLAFLRNRIRKDLGFESVPISISVRGPQKDKEW